MLAVERPHRTQRQEERRAKPARRSSRFLYPKTAAPRLHQSRFPRKNQNPQNGHHRARFDWGFGAACFGASPVAAVFGSAPGSATPPERQIYSNPTLPTRPSKQDISTLLGIGHFYFALTGEFLGPAPSTGSSCQERTFPPPAFPSSSTTMTKCPFLWPASAYRWASAISSSE